MKVLFELDGELTLQSQGKQGAAKTPVQVQAQLVYHEKAVAIDGGEPRVTRAVRHYETARATIQYKEGAVRPLLRDDRRIVALALEQAPEAVLYSPLGPLDQDELDLISVPANSALVNSLLPGRAVGVGETWKLKCDWLAALVGIDAIHQDEVTCKLDRVEKGQAIVHLQGTVGGAAEGVSSDIGLAAKYSYDIKRPTDYLVGHDPQRTACLGARSTRHQRHRPGADGHRRCGECAGAAR